MSPSVRRYNTARAILLARAAHGSDHPRTWAAYARAFVAWGNSWRGVGTRAPVLPADPDLSARLASAYTTAQLRVLGFAGHDNRSERRRRLARGVVT